MIVIRVADDRQDRVGLLWRRPRLDRRAMVPRDAHVNPIDQYRALISLVDRGLLSPEEFEVQRRRIRES